MRVASERARAVRRRYLLRLARYGMCLPPHVAIVMQPAGREGSEGGREGEGQEGKGGWSVMRALLGPNLPLHLVARSVEWLERSFS